MKKYVLQSCNTAFMSRHGQAKLHVDDLRGASEAPLSLPHLFVQMLLDDRRYGARHLASAPPESLVCQDRRMPMPRIPAGILAEPSALRERYQTRGPRRTRAWLNVPRLQ
jgi:hypothetical protein